MLSPTLLLTSLEKSGPKHSTSVPCNSGVEVLLSVDKKRLAFVVPKPVLAAAMKTPLGPHVDVASAVVCARIHSLLPFNLQMVIPFLFPVTVHVKVKVPPGQVTGGGVSCPATSPGEEIHTVIIVFHMEKCPRTDNHRRRSWPGWSGFGRTTFSAI